MAMAIACLRLRTLLPELLRNWPCLYSCMTLATLRCFFGAVIAGLRFPVSIFQDGMETGFRKAVFGRFRGFPPLFFGAHAAHEAVADLRRVALGLLDRRLAVDARRHQPRPIA